MAVVKSKDKHVRRSISVVERVDRAVRSIARRQNVSAAKVYQELVDRGLEAKEAEKRRFFQIAEQLRSTRNEVEARRLKEELARMTFGT